MAIWTAEKVFHPAHTGVVVENFYGLPALGWEVVVVLGFGQAVIVLLSVIGNPAWSFHAAVLLMHGL